MNMVKRAVTHVRFGIILLMLLLSFSAARTQDFVFIFNHLSSKDGLASNLVNCLWQDKKGFLWIGTSNGLQRYDGYHFFSPYHGDAASRLPSLPVQQIMEDSMGRVWLRMGQVIGIFDPVTFRFRRVPVVIDPPVQQSIEYHLKLDSRGHPFVILHAVGWAYFDSTSYSFREDKTPFVVSRSFQLTGVFDDTITGRFWITGNDGLAMYDKSTNQLYDYEHNPVNHPLLKDPRLTKQPAGSFYIDRKRRYWFSTWNKSIGFYCFDEHTQSYNNDTAGLSALQTRGYFEVYRFTELADSTLILYGLNCMAVRKNGKFLPIYNFFNCPYDIDYNIVYDALQDREKILWVATDNGLYCSISTVNHSDYLVLKREKGMAEITSLLEPRSGGLWLGTWGRGILTKQFDDPGKEKKEINVYKNAPPDDAYKLIWDIDEHSQSGSIWAACQAGKLIVYDTVKKRSSFIAPPAFEKRTIRQIAEDANGNLWFGTQHGLLLKWNKRSTLHDSSFHVIQRFAGHIFKLYIDNRGLLWTATGSMGVKVIDPATGKIVKQYNTCDSKEKIYRNDVRDIIQVNDSIYAFAADGLELVNFRTGKVTRAGNYNQWPVGPVLTMQVDNDNQLWLSTPTCMYKYNYPSDFFIRYNQWDGLVTVYNISYQMETSLKLTNGRIMFAGKENLVCFDPRDIRIPGSPPVVTIAGFKLFNDYLPVDSLMQLKKVKLNYNQNSISIEFASVSFRQLNKFTYYYKLEGEDRDWHPVENRQQINFTLLPPGEYKFLVRARNEQGNYSKITSLSFTILPPFWQTTWFYALVVLIIAAFLYYLYRLRINRLLHVEKIRSRLARDLHDDMGSTLSTISILSNMAAKKVSTDQQASMEYMNRISNNSLRIMDAIDDIVWSINPVNDSMRKITARMKEFAGHLLEANDIEYTFQVGDEVKEMSFDMEWRREIFLVFKEAINNIVKYAQCTYVSISMHKQKRQFVMVIADNGIGFNQENGESSAVRGNGVKNMRKRAQAMDGSLQITSSPGSGTSIILRVPLA
jgi:signal transduction histidine kinase/ligand-binding sensor domain-containing protein